MRMPQVSERIKEAPAQALRGVFAGIGQLLLITDKLRNKTPADQQVPRAGAPEPSHTARDPGPPAASSRVPPAAPAQVPPAAPARVPPAEPTLSPASIPPADPVPAPPSEPAPSADPAPAPPAEPVLETRDLDKTGNVRLLTGEKARAGDTAPTVDAVTTSDSAAAAGPAMAEEAGPVAERTASTPLPNYDELSIASLRARLRNLDVAQVRQLLVYEQAHAARPDVMAMFERRITKLQSEGADERGEAEVEAEAEAQEDLEADAQAEESEAVEDES
jgi:hypothetical protein